jgi:superfamily II DNA or RNA helicase
LGSVAAAFTIVSPRSLRALIAREFLRQPAPSRTLGGIDLKQHQLLAIGRIGEAIGEFGGAILCDPVGTGKTFTALACSRGKRALVIAPAVLRSMWLNAANRCGIKVQFISFETLSRSPFQLSSGHDLVIVDEAHHARNPQAKRYAALSALIAGRAVLMLTATPIHNRQADLQSLLQLFLGERARDLSQSELSRCVIRRDSLLSSLALPSKAPIVWHDLDCDDSVPLELLSLPPPLPPSDGGDGGALVMNSLIRQWSSSNAALEAALRRRLVQSSALIAALKDGTLPTRRELESWIGGENAVQLSFAGFLASATSDAARLLDIVESHRDGIWRILRLVEESTKADDMRADIIAAIRRENPERRIVAFASYAETVTEMFNRLALTGRVAALTSMGARVAGGRISRADALDRFAPSASGCAAPRRAEEITLLLTTDLVSEGVSLHDASCVIHLDLPWTPARVAQRVGRVVRIGSSHHTVALHAFRPPVSAEVAIRIQAILREKEHFIDASRDIPRHDEAIRDLLSTWLTDERVHTPAAAGVTSNSPGFVALLSQAGRVRIVGSRGGEISDSPGLVLRCLRECEGRECKVSRIEIALCEKRLSEWMHSDSALDDIRSPASVAARRATARRIRRLVNESKPHERSQIALLASSALTKLQQRLTHDDERRLREHLSRKVNGLEWLGELLTMLGSQMTPEKSATSIVAIIVLRK